MNQEGKHLVLCLKHSICSTNMACLPPDHVAALPAGPSFHGVLLVLKSSHDFLGFPEKAERGITGADVVGWSLLWISPLPFTSCLALGSLFNSWFSRWIHRRGVLLGLDTMYAKCPVPRKHLTNECYGYKIRRGWRGRQVEGSSSGARLCTHRPSPSCSACDPELSSSCLEERASGWRKLWHSLEFGDRNEFTEVLFPQNRFSPYPVHHHQKDSLFGSTRSPPLQESNRGSDHSFKILWDQSHWDCLVWKKARW